jgi:hypothetical protein
MIEIFEPGYIGYERVVAASSRHIERDRTSGYAYRGITVLNV